MEREEAGIESFPSVPHAGVLSIPSFPNLITLLNSQQGKCSGKGNSFLPEGNGEAAVYE